MNYMIAGDTVTVSSSDALKVSPELPVGRYTINLAPMSPITLVKAPAFKLPEKFYGEVESIAARIIRTFNARTKSTGVLLHGVKGAGKSLTAQLVSTRLAEHFEIPTIMVRYDQMLPEIIEFIDNIDTPCMVFFDEFDKVEHKGDHNKLLGMLDGTSAHKKLFMFTANDIWRVSEHIRSRPGRVYYSIDYPRLSVEAITSYCKDKLYNQDYLDEVKVVSTMSGKFSFDMLAALVEECNRFECSPREAARWLNLEVAMDKGMYDLRIFNDETGNEYVLEPCSRDFFFDFDIEDGPYHIRFSTKYNATECAEMCKVPRYDENGIWDSEFVFCDYDFDKIDDNGVHYYAEATDELPRLHLVAVQRQMFIPQF